MEIITVHDHNRMCEHGSLWPHWITVANAKWWQEPECLGGHRIVLRRVDGDLWQDITEETPEAP